MRDTIKDMIEDEIGSTSASAEQACNPFLMLLTRGVGLLRCLSDSCHLSTRRCAGCNICGHVYDNINMVFKVPEQILGRKDSQENGMCATIFPLHEAKPDDMQTSNLLKLIDKAPPLTVDNICHMKEEATLFEQSLKHALLRTIINSSNIFSCFCPEVDTCLPGTDGQMSLWRTEVHPLPAMNIDKSSTTGNSEVMDTIFKELAYPVGMTKFTGITHLTFSDQLSISHLHTLIANHVGHETLSDSYANIVFGPSFFHHQMVVVMCQARLKALKPQVPSPQSPSPAGPYGRLGGLESSACLPPKPKPGPQALGFGDGIYCLNPFQICQKLDCKCTQGIWKEVKQKEFHGEDVLATWTLTCGMGTYISMDAVNTPMWSLTCFSFTFWLYVTHKPLKHNLPIYYSYFSPQILSGAHHRLKARA